MRLRPHGGASDAIELRGVRPPWTLKKGRVCAAAWRLGAEFQIARGAQKRGWRVGNVENSPSPFPASGLPYEGLDSGKRAASRRRCASLLAAKSRSMPFAALCIAAGDMRRPR